jgi:Tol biopolymer transport system component
VRWSPDGLFVVVSGVDNPFWLLRWPLSTGREGDVRQVPGGEPEWSPDGRTIIYAETLSGALLVYGVLQAEATPFRNELRYIGTGLGEYAQGPGPRFSPASTGSDSDLIAFRSRTQQGEPQVALRRRSVGELSPLPPLTNNPAWSPGGDRLVVETGYLKESVFGLQWTPTGLSIARLSLVDDQPHQLFPLVKDAMWPAWGK